MPPMYFLTLPSIKRRPYRTKPIQMISIRIITGLSRPYLNTQLTNMSFDRVCDRTAGRSVFFFRIWTTLSIVYIDFSDSLLVDLIFKIVFSGIRYVCFLCLNS